MASKRRSSQETERRVWPLAATAFGGDYNPEQWPESIWLEDVRLMQQAGVNFVSLGIFSWARLQPSPRRYTFEWLDRIMDLLAAHGVYVNLATATASPPAWMARRHPDSVAIDAEGRAFSPGSRQHYSPFSPDYRRYAAALTRKLAERYAKHPALVMWHVNNEYACHVSADHGPHAQVAFRQWLQRRYGSLEALNEAWGTAFWSQHYYAWEEITTPKMAPTFKNPTQGLDFFRFMSDGIQELYDAEAAILREVTPGVPVTTNFMGFFRPLDAWKWAPGIDVASWDCYPDPHEDAPARRYAAAGHDLTRSLRPDTPWVLMEQATTQVNWRPVNGLKPPGQNRWESLRAVARGADGICYFQWRAAKAGAEKYHSAMVPHVGARPESRVWREVVELGADLKKLTPLVGTTLTADVAIVVCWESWWSVEAESKPARLNYADEVLRLHEWCVARNLAVNFVAPGSDLSGCRLVLAPALHLLREAHANALSAWVAAGGCLLTTFFSGIVDENEHIVLGGYPGYWRDLLGLWVEEWAGLPPGSARAVRLGRDKRAAGTASVWADLVHLTGATALATYTEDFFAGRAAATVHRVGLGRAFYLGTRFDDASLTRLLDQVVKVAGVAPVAAVPLGLEATVRRAADGRRFLCLLSRSEVPVSFRPPAGAGVDLLTGKKAGRKVTIAPRGAAFLEWA